MTARLGKRMDLIEHIDWHDRPLCYIVRHELTPSQTQFFTPREFTLQVGYVVHGAREEIPRHTHRPIARAIVGTSEVLVVQKGRCEMAVYSEDREPVATRELGEGDIVIMVAGAHGFRMLADTVLLEVKQGPYPGVEEKEKF